MCRLWMVGKGGMGFPDLKTDLSGRRGKDVNDLRSLASEIGYGKEWRDGVSAFEEF